MKWSTMTMQELCEITSSKRIFAADYVSSGVPFYRGKEITERFKGNLNVSVELFISEEKFREISEKFGAPVEADVLLTSVGTLGSVYRVARGERFYFKDGNLTWFRKFNRLDSRFLFYWLVSPQGKAQLSRATIGAAQPALTIAHLKKMDISLPPLPTQRRIASILSAYDDLIENNTKRIEILEEMARSLYREWFVHFRFPGHEKVKLVDSELGKIPEGWEVSKLGDVFSIKYGKTLPKTKLLPDGEFPVYGAGGVIGRFSSSTIDGPTALVTSRGAGSGVVWRASERGFVTNNSFMVHGVGRQETWSFLFIEHFLRHTNIPGAVSGSAQPQLTAAGMSSVSCYLPPLSPVDQYSSVALPMVTQSILLERKNRVLRQTRDLLLPKLISGEIDVDALDLPEAS